MTPAEEDALVKSCWKLEANQYARYQHLTEDKIRLAIRAAVAAERERCAKVCFGECVVARSFEGWEQHNNACADCAAAIRRGGLTT